MGGIVGKSHMQDDVQNCYSTATIVTGDSGTAGGVIGTAGEWVRHVYATGPVSGGAATSTGGLVGTHYRRFYWFQGMEGGPARTGYLPAGLVDGYWDSLRTGQIRSVGKAESTTVGAVALTATRMTEAASFPGFAFDSVWSLVPGQTPPLLRSVPGGVAAKISGEIPSSLAPQPSRLSTPRLRRIGRTYQIELPEASHLRLVNIAGRSHMLPLDLPPGQHALAFPATPSLQFLQITTPHSTTVLPIPPSR